MPTEVEIRESIAATIASVATNAIVVPRNILDIKNDAWTGLLKSSADNNRIHGWMVTQKSAQVAEKRQNSAQYDLEFSVWQFVQYFTGSDTTNSEDLASAEREAVMEAFANPAALSADLSWVEPIEFPVIDLFPIGTTGGMVHIAQGTLRVSWKSNC